LPEWVVERGIGETRSVRIHADEIVEARVLLEGVEPAGAILEGRLIEMGFPAVARVGDQQYLLPKGASGVTEGALIRIAVTRERLRLYDVPEQEIARLIRTRQPSGQVTWYALHGGTVLEKPAIQGMNFEEGTTLYRMADLSTVWVMADVPEALLAGIENGLAAEITLSAYPGRVFRGVLTFVYPEVAMATRTAKVRIELPNPDGTIKPGMFAAVNLKTAAGEAAIVVPESALIDSGVKQIVLVTNGSGTFEPRAVVAARRNGTDVEIASGLNEGEEVVTSATFLIDAESNLKAALQGMAAATSASAEKKPP